MKKFLPGLFILLFSSAKAQQIDSIYVHLYTDSLKKGTYNYINIDGLLPNGRYLPLDTTQLIFTSSAGKFYGNSLFIDKNIDVEKVTIKAVLKTKPVLNKEFVLYIKKKNDDENLKSVNELINEMPNPRNKRKKG